LSVRSPAFTIRHDIQLKRSSSLIHDVVDFDLVPSELVENTRLVTDPTLEPNEAGQLYMSQESYYNPKVEPQYALTTHSSLYTNTLLKEIHDAHTVPCGFYWCCHEAAMQDHFDESHANDDDATSDHVDIRIAWTLAGVFMTVILCA
jgi:hypothetical protein